MIQFKKLNSKRLVVQRFLFTFLILFNININASDINQSILLKEISLLKEENKNLKVKIENVEWKREESVSNINDRIESFGNFLEVANNWFSVVFPESLYEIMSLYIFKKLIFTQKI